MSAESTIVKSLESENRSLRLKLEKLEKENAELTKKCLQIGELNIKLEFENQLAHDLIKSLELRLGKYQGEEILKSIINS